MTSFGNIQRWQLLPVNLVLRYTCTSFSWLFGAYFLCFWYCCTHVLVQVI